MKTNKYQKDVQFIRQIKNALSSKKVLVSIGVTLGIILFFNFFSKITMPYLTVPTNPNESNSFVEMLNLLGGGGLTSLSLFAVGISPYIMCQIIVQLLSSDIIPPLSKLAQGGDKGRRKIEIITRISTLPFAIIQAYSVITLFKSQGVTFMLPGSEEAATELIPPTYQALYIITMVAGTYVAIFLSDVITKRGIGNGVTTIILSGIVSSLIGNFSLVWTNMQAGISGQLYQVIAFIFYICFYVMILWTITFITCSSRKIPIQQVGQSLIKLGEDLPYLPFKLNTGGVIPVIFSSSLMTLPLTISQIVAASDPGNGFVSFANAVFNFRSIGGIIVYMVLIMLFTFFYSYVQINPQKISNDFMKSGRFVIGVKIGETTEKYIAKVLYRINWIGGPFLAIITSLPYIASMITATTAIPGGIIPSISSLGGTGIIIIVSATIDLWQSVVSASTTISYTTEKRKINTMYTSDENTSQNMASLW